MNSVEFVTKYMMLRHPYIFPSKISVLDYLFMSNGNGCEWKNGEIHPSEGIPSDLDFDKLADSTRKKIERNKDYPEIVKRQCYFIIDNVDLLIKKNYPFQPYQNYYGIYKDVSLCTKIPDDIKEDWRRALLGFIRYYKLYLNEMMKGKVTISDTSYIEQITYVEAIIKRCEE